MRKQSVIGTHSLDTKEEKPRPRTGGAKYHFKNPTIHFWATRRPILIKSWRGAQIELSDLKL